MTGPLDDGRLDELLAQASWLDRLARRLVRDPCEADDVVQETWVAALRERPRVRSARAWLAQVARNVVLQRGRSECARQQREHAVARAEASVAEAEAFERAQAQQRLVEAVLALEEPCRGALILHYFDHLGVDEVALRLGVPESTVRTRLSRGVAELRAHFQRRDGAQWALAFLPLASSKSGALAAPLLGGTLVATGTKLAAAAALIAALVWFAWPGSTSMEASSPGASEGSKALDAQALQSQPPPALDAGAAAGERTALEAAQAPKTELAGSDRATLDVHVRWGDDGTNASGIGVELWLAGAVDPFHDRRSGRTDAQGRAHFEDLAPGHVNIELDRADGGCKLAPGEHATVELTIPDGFDLSGRVVDGDERPVAGARIWLSQYFNHSNGSEVATSDAGGQFLVRDVGPARYVGARHERFSPSALELLQEANAGQRIETKLVLGREAAEVSGSVRDAAGRPVAGASVQVELAIDFERDEAGVTRQKLAAPERARTDENGRFLVRGLGTSATNFVVHAPGFAPSSQHAQLEPGHNDLEFTLAPMAAVHGRVLDAAGAPVKQAFVGYGEYGAAASAQTWSREDGSFKLIGLPAGALELRVDAQGKGTLRRVLELQPGDDLEWQVELVAKPGIAGRVLDAAGKPAAGFMVGAISTDHSGLFLRNTKTDAEGRFELGDWPAEANAVEVREEGAWVGLPAALVEAVKPGSGEELVIPLAADALRSAWFTGRVVDEQGKSVEAAELFCFVESSGQGTSVATDSAGRFRYGPVRPGRYFLSAHVKGYADRTLRGLALAPDETRDVGELRLERPGEIRVSLRLPAGFAPEQAGGYVALIGADGTAVQSIEIRAGAGRLGGLPSGHYGLRFTSERLRAAPAEVDVLAGQSSEVELQAAPGTSRMVSVRVPAEARDARVRLCVRAASSAIVYEEQAPVRPGQALYFSAAGLVLGSYSVEASTAEGLHAKGSLEVTKLEPENTVLELELK